ncbi:hypothetical protein TSUD_397150 [Trifolium subterraneum]|uniref:Uncharacterized protein n=1 Tax=Trifolium subterraneum TaxID=3900 RepID=A0A2Z6N751_TRISU|nr:hypothetical protein TSUD_397150 [Trifolium subterraneum]
MVCNDGLKVDEMFDDDADILPGREDVHIKVRVLRLWKVSAFLNPIETSSIEMILVDEKPGRESWRIKVRVLMIWDVPSFLNPGETNAIEMILIDEKMKTKVQKCECPSKFP